MGEMVGIFPYHGLTLMLQAATMANTKWCKYPENWLKPWHMGMHPREPSESYPMNTNTTGSDAFQNLWILVLCTKLASALEGLSWRHRGEGIAHWLNHWLNHTPPIVIEKISFSSSKQTFLHVPGVPSPAHGNTILNPSKAKTTFILSTMTKRFLKPI